MPVVLSEKAVEDSMNEKAASVRAQEAFRLMQEIQDCLNPGLAQGNHFRNFAQAAVELEQIISQRIQALDNLLNNVSGSEYGKGLFGFRLDLEVMRNSYAKQRVLLVEITTHST